MKPGDIRCRFCNFTTPGYRDEAARGKTRDGYLYLQYHVLTTHNDKWREIQAYIKRTCVPTRGRPE